MNFAITSLKILNGATESNVLNPTSLRNVEGITLISPAALAETVTILVSADGVLYGTLQSGGNDINPAAGKALSISPLPSLYLKLKANGAVAAERVFGLIVGQGN